MTQPLAVLQSLAKLERLEPAASKPTPSSFTTLPPLPISASSTTASDADECSVLVHSARPAQSGRRSHSRASSLSSPLQPPVRPRSPSSPRQAQLPWRSSHSAETAEELEEEEEDEMRLHAQFRLKQRLREKTRLEAGRRARQQARPRDDCAEDEDEEEREARLTSLAHRMMPPSPVIRTRSLKDGSAAATMEEELGAGHKDRLSAESGSTYEEEEEKCSNYDVRAVDGRATSVVAGAATPCLRVAKRLPQPGKSYSQLAHSSRAESFQSPLSSYASSPTVLSTASTAGPSPAVSIPSITRSVLSHSLSSTYRSSTFASPYSSASLLASPLPASPSVLPSVLPLSPVADESGGKLQLLEGRPSAIFSRRHLT